MRTEIVEITPTLAADMLLLNTHNRKYRTRQIEFLANEMSSGNWVLNGSPIIINDDRLIDGQHRLYACVKAKTPFTSLVVRDVDPDVFKTIDKGLKRTQGDTLYIKGEVYSTILAAAAVRLRQLETNASLRGGKPLRSDTELVELIDANPGLRRSVKKCHNSKMTSLKLMTSSLAAALHYSFSQKDEELADSYFAHLATGGVFDNKHPVNLLREKLLIESHGVTKIHPNAVAVLAIKVWNTVRSGSDMKILKILPDEKRPIIL